MKKYLLGLYEKSMPEFLTLKEKLENTAKAGFDYMELSIDETDKKLSRLDMTQQEIRKVIDDMFDTGIPIKSICLSGHRKYPLGHPDNKIREMGMNIMKRAIDLAAQLSVRIIQIAGYDIYYQQGNLETRQLFCENLAKSVEMAACKGVTLAFETMETEFMNTIGKAMEHINYVDSPWLQVYPDLGNITNAARTYGTSVSDDLLKGRGHISAIHLKETVPGVFREVPFGTGHVDFDDAVSLAVKLGVRMYVGEFWYTGNDDWFSDLVFANNFLRERLDRAVNLL